MCGIALRSSVISDLSQDEPAETETPETASESGSDPAKEVAPEVDDQAEAEIAAKAVPNDEFVDISALRGDEEAEADDEGPTGLGVAQEKDAQSEPAAEPETVAAAAAETVSDSRADDEVDVIPDDEFVDISALRADETEKADEAPADEPEVASPEPPAPAILDETPKVSAHEPEKPEEKVVSDVRPLDEVIETPLPGAPAATGSSANDQAEETSEQAVEARPEPEAVESSPSEDVENSAPENQPAEGSAAEEEEDAPDFLEDATLLSIPVSDVDLEKIKREAGFASKEKTPKAAPSQDKPKPDDASAEQAAAEAEPVPEMVDHHKDGETTLEEGVDTADETPSPAALVEDDSDRPGTTPNIGAGDTAGSKAPKLKPLSEGTVLNGRYEIVRKIGGGGMGAVYLASDKNLGGVLRAVKEMVQSYIEEDQQEKAVQDFKRESMLLTSLEHRSIPTIYDYFFDEGAHRFYLVMKYISGGDLAARLRSAPEGKLEEQEVTEWAIQIADVLDYLHNRQPPIVYRDLKPANIMVDGNSGKVMLIDFGIARWINKEEKGVTAVGTMGYAPPELFSGNVVPSSDIYSLGSTVFHLLTGADPQNNPLLIFDFEKNPKPRQINPRLSDQIESILMRSVEYNAEKRFASAAEMRAALADHLTNLKAGNVTYGKTETPKSVGFSDQTVFCGFCGQKIVATDMFCAFCGAKQPLAQPGVQSQDYVPVKLTAKLMIEGTSQLDYPSFDLAKDENLVGRRDPMSNIFPEVDLSKFDPQTKISRKHARIFKDGERYMLEDLGSSNGTTIIAASNETVKLIPLQARELAHGDRIKLGDTILHFVVSA